MKRDIWNMQDYQCPVIGTCLSTVELHKLAARVRLVLPENATDYELHGCFVSLARQPERPARMVQKYMDKKFHRQLKRVANAAGDEDLWTHWAVLADSGDIPGAFWALMRHPNASDKLLAQIYGEVHMLSHLVGASTRADLRRLSEAQAQIASLTETLAARKRVLREAVAVWKRRARDLETQLAAESARREKAEREKLSLRELLQTNAVHELERDRNILREQTETALDRAGQAEATVRRQALLIEKAYREEVRLKQALAERDAEMAALELLLGQAPASCDKACSGPECAATCADADECPCPRLRGKRVLFVGGRSGLRSQYRDLGTRYGCEVLHHDGGIEQSQQHLQQMLTRADAVVCPVDCVSHEACAAVKRLCKKTMKPVLFARTSGLSSLAASLVELDRTCQ